MYRRILLIALLGLLTSACVPYYEDGRYYRSNYYTSDRYYYPSYYRHDRYYVAPQPRYYQPRYYQSAPRYYRSAPSPYYKPYRPPCEPVAWQPAERLRQPPALRLWA